MMSEPTETVLVYHEADSTMVDWIEETKAGEEPFYTPSFQVPKKLFQEYQAAEARVEQLKQELLKFSER